MTSICLQNIVSESKSRRFYLAKIQPTLFGEFELIREWGSIGKAGRVAATTYPSELAAKQALFKLCKAKQHLGYALIW